MADDDRQAGLDDLTSPFLFVSAGEPDPAAWKAAHPGWVSFPATMAPRAATPLAQGDVGSDRANWPKDRWGRRYRPLDEYAPGERAPGFPEPDSAGFGAMMAAMDDPVGTLRGLGYDLAAASHDSPASRRASTLTRPHRNTERIDKFFDDLDAPLREAASQLGVPPEWLLGLAARESGWLNPHNRSLNNPMGLTHGGGKNVHYRAFADAIAYFVETYARQVRGAKSPADFAARLRGKVDGIPVPGWQSYNDVDPNWETEVAGAIAPIPSHRQNRLDDRRSR